MIEKIAVIFNKGLGFDIETIKAEHFFTVNYIDIFFEEELANKNVLLEYIAVIDSTQNQNYINSLCKYGTKVKQDIEYYQIIKNETDRFNITSGPTFQNLFIKEDNKDNYPTDFIKKINENKILFKKTIDFFKVSMLKSITNQENFINGLKHGIEISNADEKRKYVLVNSFPERKEQGVEYIIPENIKLLSELIDILKYKI